MELRRIGAVSLAKISACCYAVLGLIIGAVFSLIAVLASSVAEPGTGGPLMGLFGAAAVIVLPICYGVAGFIGALIMAGVYNLVAGIVGGIHLDLQPTSAGAPPQA